MPFQSTPSWEGELQNVTIVSYLCSGFMWHFDIICFFITRKKAKAVCFILPKSCFCGANGMGILCALIFRTGIFTRIFLHFGRKFIRRSARLRPKVLALRLYDLLWFGDDCRDNKSAGCLFLRRSHRKASFSTFWAARHRRYTQRRNSALWRRSLHTVLRRVLGVFCPRDPLY